MDVGTLESGGLDAGLRGLALSQGSLSLHDIRPITGIQGVQRGLGTSLASMQTLGIDIDKSSPIMRGILSALITAEVSGNVIQAAKAIVTFMHAREVAEAAALTTANAAIPVVGWGKIAVATGAALMVGAAFGVGFHLGRGSGADAVSTSAQTLSVDISDPVARRAAIRGTR